jgi:ferredoxin
MLTFAGLSAREKEPRAATRALVGAVLLPIPYIGAGIIGLTIASPLISLIILCSTGVLFFFFVLPIGNRFPEEDDKPTTRFDERDIMFSRRSLVPGTDRFQTYYQANPDKKALDDKFRRRPGLLVEGALFYDALSVAAAKASFETVGTFHQILDREQREVDPDPVDKIEMSRFLKRWTKKLGAVSAGITELQEYHLYSTIGRGERYGEPVELDHHYALAITVEMDKVTMDSAPYGPTVMESAQQYLNSGAIAVQVAQFIRNLGYSARAHIDGSYRVICPLVARDAGLGEIGRMGLLMTPELGPRVRLAVVTTDMPLMADQRECDRTMIDFCRKCLKCADVCPSNSIPTGKREDVDGVLRWRIDAESCFTYWCTIGTDCGLCMRSCPFSHPDNALHNVIRAGVKRSAQFRRLALILDNLFYGRVPVRAEIPSWIKAESQL